MAGSPAGSPNAMSVGPVGGLANLQAGSGKGGTKGQPAQTMPAPTAQPQYAPMQSSPAAQEQFDPLAPKGPFNVNRAAAGALQQAMMGTQAGMGYNPQQVQATDYAAAQMGPAGQVASADLEAYTNPFESQVVDQSLADLERSRLMQQNQLGAQASASNAFGGSRQGIAEAETNRAFADQAARTASGLRQVGFQNAQQLAGQDINRQMQADQLNQAALNQQRQFGASQGMSAQQLNQGAGLEGAQLRLGASGQMGRLGQQAFNTGQAIQQQQMQQGLMQQGLQQSLIDAARGQYQNAVNAPMQSLNASLAALGAQPNQSTTTESRSPGLFDYLSLGATAGAGR